MREYHKKRYHEIRQEAIESLGGFCHQCGSEKNIQFDHISPEEKTLEISEFLSVSMETFLLELNKCQLLCKYCHEKKSILEQGKNLAKGTHGTLSSYRYCKCDLCRQAKREYMKKYNENRFNK